MLFSFPRKQLSTLVFCQVAAFDLRVVVFISFDSAVDMKIDDADQSKAFVLILDFHVFRLSGVIKQFDTFSDQRYRGFI